MQQHPASLQQVQQQSDVPGLWLTHMQEEAGMPQMMRPMGWLVIMAA
jgi:hypothetical protein